MFNALFLLVSFFGISGYQQIVETVKPPQPCQEHSCENESFLSITSSNGISTFELVAQQLGLPLSQANLEAVIIAKHNLNSSSTDFE
jgi:hypothetical protein